jgi:MerR family mercuric resistance operon transcriptional regulator
MTITKPRALRIGALSRRSGVHVETIRYYERIGLIGAAARSGGGQRLYGGEDLERLRFIRRARELGFSIGAIRELIGLVDGGGSCAAFRDAALRHAADVRAKIDDLRRIERVLTDAASRCQGASAPRCPVVEALALGAGTSRPDPVRPRAASASY